MPRSSEYRDILISLLGENNPVATESVINPDGSYLYFFSGNNLMHKEEGKIIGKGLISRASSAGKVGYTGHETAGYERYEIIEIRNVSDVNIRLINRTFSDYYEDNINRIRLSKMIIDDIYHTKMATLFADIKNGLTPDDIRIKYGVTSVEDLTPSRELK